MAVAVVVVVVVVVATAGDVYYNKIAREGEMLRYYMAERVQRLSISILRRRGGDGEHIIYVYTREYEKQNDYELYDKTYTRM